MDEEDEIYQANFIILKMIWKRLMQKLKQDDLHIQKSANAREKTASHMDTPLLYMEANGMTN